MTQIEKPAVGTFIRVETDYSQYKQGFAQNVQRTYRVAGKVVESQAWEGETVFSLITSDPKMPIKSIDRKFVKSITELKADDIHATDPNLKSVEQDENSDARVFDIKSSSRAGTYAVTKKGSNWTCSCPAGERGRRCKHIAEAQEILRKEKANAKV